MRESMWWGVREWLIMRAPKSKKVEWKFEIMTKNQIKNY